VVKQRRIQYRSDNLYEGVPVGIEESPSQDVERGNGRIGHAMK
jgi:hypothetical protein